MGKVEVVFSDPAAFKGQKAAQTFKRQSACCNDSLFALLFVANLALVVFLFADFLFLKQDGGFQHIEKIANTTSLCTNETQVVFGLDICETTPWRAATTWISEEFVLVERDVRRNFDLMAVSGVIGLCLGLIWLQLLKRFTSCIVRMTLLLVVFVTGCFGYIVYKYAHGCLWSGNINLEGHDIGCSDELQPLSDTEMDVLKTAAYGIWAVGAVLLLVIILLNSKIALTVAIFEEACRGCLTNIGIYPVTLVIVLLVVSFHFFWFSTLSYMYSIPSDHDVTMSFVGEASVSVRMMLMYLVFCYLWVCAFLGALFHASVAGIVGSWYFNRHHAAESAVVSSWRALWRNLTVSAGSLAFGSLIMGIIGFLRYILKKCESWSKKQPALGTVFKCCKCCLCCIEKFVEVVNKYAYVYVAMESCSFCAGAKKSFALIREYPIQMVVMKAINWFVLLCGKLFLTATTVIFFILSLERLDRDFCVLFIVLYSVGAFQVFRFQANIIAAATDTIFVCYVMDLNLNNGEAVHLKTSAGLHAKVQAAVLEYERANPEEVQLRKRVPESDTTDDDDQDDAGSPLTAPTSARP